MEAETPRARSRAWDGAALAVALLICALTLAPSGPSGAPGELGAHTSYAADALRNLALFVPLAICLTLAGHGAAASLLACAVFSTAIELLQLAIPGRMGGPSDVVFNSLGGGAAIALFARRRLWLAPTPASAVLLSGPALALPWLVLPATSWLLSPEVPIGQSFGGWNPEFEGMHHYPGPVLEARIGELEIARAGPIDDPAGLRRALLEGEPIRLRWQVAESPPGLSPLVIVIGPASEELALVAARRSDLVIRRWRRSARLLLEQPELTWPGVLAGLEPGRIAGLLVRSTASGVSIELDAGVPRHLGLGPGRGWALLAPDSWIDPRRRPLVDALWLAILLLPLGLWLGPGWTGLGAAGAALACLWLLPGPLGLETTTPGEWSGAIAGLLVGRGIAATVRPRSAAG
jgi:hypothetical protein